MSRSTVGVACLLASYEWEKYLQLQLLMNQEIGWGVGLSSLLNLLQHRDLYTVVSYLDEVTISTLLRSLPPARAGKFLQVVRITYFLRRYLTRTDRSLYMPFYAEDGFRRTENELLRVVCGHSTSALSYFLAAYYHITARLSAELQGFECAGEVIGEVMNSLLDPELPFPKLRKQTVGSHCNSAFQYYLVDKLLAPDDLDDPGDAFSALREFLQQRQSTLPAPSGEQQALYCSVFCEWFKISYQNFEESIIPGSTAHNFIVLLVALVDLLVDSTRFFVQAIKDPLHSFIEFNVRYCMLRNAILALENRLSFVFSDYSSFCVRVLKREPQVREMSIWHVMLSKWYLHMHRHHEEYFRMFFYLLRKVNLEAIQCEVGSHLGEDEAFIEFKNRLELCDVDLLQREECFQLYSPLEEYFESDAWLYKQLIQEYMQYKVDISVNEYSVHWCGYSAHDLHLPYRDFEALFLPHFANYITRLIAVAREVPRVGIAVDRAFCALLDQIDCDFLKPVTLKKVLQVVREQASALLGSSFGQSSLAHRISETEGYFSVADKKLKLFNAQNNITNESTVKFSIIVENEDFNKMLKESASTAGSRPCNAKFLAEYHQEEDFIEQDFEQMCQQ